MAAGTPAAVMPPKQAKALRDAYGAYRSAIDPNDPWALARQAVVVRAALTAGWSARTVAEALRIERARIPRIAAVTPAGSYRIEAPASPKSVFPAKAVGAYRRHEDEVNLRRIRAERQWVATVRSARAAGWPSSQLGRLLGISGERVRVTAEMELDLTGITPPVFDPYAPPARPAREVPAAAAPPRPSIGAEDRARMLELAAAARGARKTGGARRGGEDELTRRRKTLEARKASEELSDMIITAKKRGVTWPELDEACGYSRGGARARAARHGYGKPWPSVPLYARTGTDTLSGQGGEA